MNKFFRLLTLGELTGLVSGGLIVCVWPWTGVIVERPVWLLAVVVWLAAATSFVVAAVASAQGFLSAVAVRRGVTGATMSAIVSVSVFALMARLLPGYMTSLWALFAGWLSVMPAMLAGMIAACFAVVLCRRPMAVPAESSVAKFTSWGLRGLVGVLALAGVLAPVQWPWTKAAAPVVSVTQRPKPEPPGWSYVPPAGLEVAHALQWQLKDQRELMNVVSSTVVLSKDDQWLGYVSSGDHALIAIELNHPSNTKCVPLPHSVDRLSFAPDGRRVFLMSEGESVEVGVGDFSTGRYTALPKPRHRAMPMGQIAWWQDAAVIAQTRQNGDWMLSLETLELERADAIEAWKSLNLDQRALLAPEFFALPATPRWSWERRQTAFNVELPEEARADEWGIKGGVCLCLQHPQYDARMVFRSIGLDFNDRLLATRDGSKVIRVHGGTATLFYFNTGPSPTLQWKAVSPLLPPPGPGADRIQNALKAGTLAAYVYAPLINPLNNKVVGPDRSVVKGVVSVRDWKDSSITVYATELQCTLDHAIIADLHIRTHERLELIKFDHPHRWWAELSEAVPGSDNIALIPSRTDKIKQLTDADSEEKKAAIAREEAARKQREAEMPKVEPRPVPSTPANAGLPSADDPIKQFILNHHKKSEQGDARALVADYADRVDYFSDGLVTSAQILRDELQYHQTHRILEESVQGEIRINKLNATGFTASYLLRNKVLDLHKGATKEGLFDVNLIVIQTPAGLRITRQRAEKKP